MTEHEPRDPAEIDFVVGAAGGPADDEILDTGTPRHTDRRLLIGLAVAALVVLGVAVVVHSHNPTHTSAGPSKSSGSPSTSPVVPSFGNEAPAPDRTVSFTPVILDAKLCVAHSSCSRIPTPRGVLSKIRAALTRTFGGVRRLRIRNSAIGVDDPPRKSLFARGIDATTPLGRIQVVAAAVNPDSSLSIPIAGERSLGTQTVTAGYVVGGSVAAKKGVDPLTLTGRLNRLLGDARLVAKS